MGSNSRFCPELPKVLGTFQVEIPPQAVWGVQSEPAILVKKLWQMFGTSSGFMFNLQEAAWTAFVRCNKHGTY